MNRKEKQHRMLFALKMVTINTDHPVQVVKGACPAGRLLYGQNDEHQVFYSDTSLFSCDCSFSFLSFCVFCTLWSTHAYTRCDVAQKLWTRSRWTWWFSPDALIRFLPFLGCSAFNTTCCTGPPSVWTKHQCLSAVAGEQPPASPVTAQSQPECKDIRSLGARAWGKKPQTSKTLQKQSYHSVLMFPPTYTD